MFYIESGGNFAAVPISSLFATMAISCVIGLVFYLFMSFGLYKMAKNEGLDKAKFAFVPFYRWLILGKIVKKGMFFGRMTDKIGVIALVAVAFTVFTQLSYFICEAAGMVKAYQCGYEIVYSMTENSLWVIPAESSSLTGGMDFVMFQKYYYTGAFYVFDNVVYYLNYLSEIVYIFLMYGVWNAIFMRYKPMGATMAYVIVATLIGASSPLLNIGGLFVFRFRNRKPFDVEEYVRRANQNRNNYYGNDYGNGNNGNYGRDNYNSDPYGRYSDPFDAYGNDRGGNKKDEPDNPFDEFDN